MKRLETFLTSPGQADPAWQPLGRTVCWLEKSKASPFSTAAELHETWSPEVPVSTRTVCRILSRNGLHGRISAQKPALNKRQLKKLCGFCQGPQPSKRMDAGKVAEGRFLRWIFCWITSVAANIAGDLLEPAWIREQSSLVAEKSWSGVTSSMGVCERSAGWKASIV